MLVAPEDRAFHALHLPPRGTKPSPMPSDTCGWDAAGAEAVKPQQLPLPSLAGGGLSPSLHLSARLPPFHVSPPRGAPGLLHAIWTPTPLHLTVTHPGVGCVPRRV